VSTLHTIARAPRSDLLSSCLELCGKKDAILFIEDGVYYCLAAEQLTQLPEACKLFALREDMTARGLQAKSPARVELVSTRTFVELCCQYDKVVNWF